MTPSQHNPGLSWPRSGDGQSPIAWVFHSEGFGFDHRKKKRIKIVQTSLTDASTRQHRPRDSHGPITWWLHGESSRLRWPPSEDTQKTPLTALRWLVYLNQEKPQTPRTISSRMPTSRCFGIQAASGCLGIHTQLFLPYTAHIMLGGWSGLGGGGSEWLSLFYLIGCCVVHLHCTTKPVIFASYLLMWVYGVLLYTVGLHELLVCWNDRVSICWAELAVLFWT